MIPILDAMRTTPGGSRAVYAPKITVDVTREIIDQAEQRDSAHCMVAEAVKQAFPRASKISVDVQTIRFTDPDLGRRYAYLTPRRAQYAIVDFDAGRPTEPFRLQLRGGSVTRSAAGRRKGLDAKRIPNKPRLTDPTLNGNVPIPIGGRMPPQGALASGLGGARRRQFGLRAMDR